MTTMPTIAGQLEAYAVRLTFAAKGLRYRPLSWNREQLGEPTAFSLWAFVTDHLIDAHLEQLTGAEVVVQGTGEVVTTLPFGHLNG